MASIFEIQDVTFTHNPNLPPVLRGFNLSVEEGQRTAILGANGAGKTTMFYTLTGVYKPQSGQVVYKGEPIDYSVEGLQKLRSDVAVVLQNPDEQIFCSLVEEDVAFGPLNLGQKPEDIEDKVTKALRDVRMVGYEKRPIQQLSGGQRKRIAIAGALVMDPKVMIMDEPTAGLDPQASMEVLELAEKLSLRGVTVLISTHDIDLAYKWAETSKVLCNGQIEYAGPAEDFYAETERVYKCGLLSPAIYNMNREISTINGEDLAPYPCNCCEFTAKFGKASRSGRILCVPSEEEEAVGRYESALQQLKGASVGVYGSDVRYALADKDIEFAFDAIDACFTQAVRGKDSILIYDSVYKPTVERQAKRLKEFGFDADMEVI
jgi:cobalt/nickel transport system ATP-binding protein